MIEKTLDSDIARAWLEGLATLGIRVTLVGKKLVFAPLSAYKTLTDEQALILRRHRQAIKDAVAAGMLPDLGPSFPVTDKRRVTVDSTPQPCTCCGQTPCIGPEHEAFATLHPDDPSEFQKRQEQHAREFWFQMAQLDWRLAYRWANRTL